MFIFVVQDGGKFRYIAVLVYKNSTGNSTMDKETTLTERTACLNGKFFIFSLS
jgi:hypothetical protein